jgi:hypothetical protein
MIIKTITKVKVEKIIQNKTKQQKKKEKRSKNSKKISRKKRKWGRGERYH